MVEQMMAEDEALIQRKKCELETIRSRFRSLFFDLYPEKICPEFEKSFSLLPAIRIYLEEFEKLEKEHEKLVEKEFDIRHEEKQLCEQLNEVSLQTNSNEFLRKAFIHQMSLLSDHIAQLKEEKVRLDLTTNESSSSNFHFQRKRVAHLSDILRNLQDFELIYGWKRPKPESLIGQLLDFGLVQIEKFPLDQHSISIVDQQFRKVRSVVNNLESSTALFLAQINEEIQKAEGSFEKSTKKLNVLMRKHQSLIPNNRVVTMTNEKKCRISKLPEVRRFETEKRNSSSSFVSFG